MSRRKQNPVKTGASAAPAPVPTAAAPLPEAPASLWPKGPGRLLFLGLLAVGAVLRLVWLGRASLQIDEVNVIRFALDAPDLVAAFQNELQRFTFIHRLPLLMILIKLSMSVFPFDGGYPPEWIARLPMALLGILALPVFYLLGRRARNEATGLWCMTLATLSVYHVYYARECYDYAIVMFFTVATLWSSIELLSRWRAGSAPPWSWGALYAASSTGLLYSHLSCLLFLASWNALMAGWLLSHDRARLFRGLSIAFWAATFGAAYVLFSPFLLKLGGGFHVTEGALAKRFSLAVFPALWGRMGWGETLPALLPFTALFLLGFGAALRRREEAVTGIAARFSLPAILAVQFVIYVAVQCWMLRVSRFEVRYFSPMFPILIFFVAAGLQALLTRLAARVAQGRAALVPVAVGILIAAVAAPSLLAVCAIDSRGANYKGIARWVQLNLPEGGVYAFYNVAELRAVPTVYPTPGRHATSVSAWSSDEDFLRINPPARAKSLFTRFPLVAFIEMAPEDLCNPEKGLDPIDRTVDRDSPFLRREWIEDAATDRLFRWRTHPTGETQWMNSCMHRVCISFNRPEDLPALARKHGRMFYHAFGPGWQYVNDQGFNHWMLVSTGAQFIAGNVSISEVTATLRLRLYAPPPGGRLHIFSAQGARIGSVDVGAQGIGEAALDQLTLPPGETAFRFAASPRQPGGEPARVLLYSAELLPAAAATNAGR